MTKNDIRVLRLMRTAVEGLKYHSKDEAHGWDVLFEDHLRFNGIESALKCIKSNAPPHHQEHIPTESFFSNLTAAPAPKAEKDDHMAYRSLQQVIRILISPAVYRLRYGTGTVIAIIGGFPGGGTVVLKTQTVEG